MCVNVLNAQEKASKSTTAIAIVRNVNWCLHSATVLLKTVPNNAHPLTSSLQQHFHFINVTVITSHMNYNVTLYIPLKIMKCYSSRQFISMKP